MTNQPAQPDLAAALREVMTAGAHAAALMQRQLAAALASRAGLVSTLHGVRLPMGARVVELPVLVDANRDLIEHRAAAVEDHGPEFDPPGTVRVHPADDRASSRARRWAKDDSGHAPWRQITGFAPAPDGSVVSDDLDDEEVEQFDVQPWGEFAQVMGLR